MFERPLGHRRWAIAGGHIPERSHGPALEMACVIESDRPIVVQHTRLDSRQAANALFSTIAFPA